MPKKAIEISNYSFKYSNSKDYILKDINLSIDYGSITLIKGDSGQGKSTLLHSINGLIPNIYSGDQEGDILVNGLSIKGKRIADIASSIGSILQNPESQIVNQRVDDEIAFGCENLGLEPELIKERIDYFGNLMELSPQSFTKTLSGGQKQKLVIASVLAMNQRIIILDEPFANVDLESAHKILKILKSLAHEGYAIILAEHRHDLVTPYADTVFSLNEGVLFKNTRKTFEASPIKDNDSLGNNSKKLSVLYSLKDIHYQAKDKIILTGIDLQIYEGESLVILGENGAGKTTLLKIMARLLKPSKGTVDGVAKIGYVFQNPNYQLFMPRVIEEVAFGAKNKALASQLLLSLGLNDLKDMHPQALSEGQKRRLTVASILAMEPSLILLDEPSVGQDQRSLEAIMTCLKDYQLKTNATLVSITHDYEYASYCSDRIVWMSKGNIKKIGNKTIAKEYKNLCTPSTL